MHASGDSASSNRVLSVCLQRATGCTGTPPSSSEVCTVAPCASTTYSFVSLPWGTCSQTCGIGFKSRQLYCADASGRQVSDLECATVSKPTLIEGCQAAACTSASYSFVTQPWGGCSVSCGNGFQTRSAYCIGSNSAAVDDSMCLSSSAAPLTQQACAMPACITHSFVTTLWASCSVSCGSGVRSRLVYCTANGGQQVSDAQCLGGSSLSAKPTSTEACSLPTCVRYSFVATVWASCSVSCGSGVRSRQVYCTANGGQQVSDSLCNESTSFSSLGVVPSTTEACSLPQCVVYSFITMPWGGCSVSCGTGQQQRQVHCYANGQQVAENLCAGQTAISKPASSQACSSPSCLSFSYSPALWGACSVTCGDGFQTRAIACRGNRRYHQLPSLCFVSNNNCRKQSPK